jgi:hypothetical protein
LDLNYKGCNCKSGECEYHISGPLVLKKGNPKEENSKTIWLIFYHDWNMGDEFDPNHPIGKGLCGAYHSKEAALAALQLPPTATPPNGVEGESQGVEPNPVEDVALTVNSIVVSILSSDGDSHNNNRTCYGIVVLHFTKISYYLY